MRSIPPKFWARSSVVEHVTDNDGVGGSIPPVPTFHTYPQPIVI